MLSRAVLPSLFFAVGLVPALVGQSTKKYPPPLTEADLQKMSPAEVKDLFKKVKLPEDDPSPDPGNKDKKGGPPTGEVMHKGMIYGPCLAATVDLPDPHKKMGDEAGNNVVLRGLTIKLDHDTTICYDLDTLAVAAVWTGGFLDLSKSSYENSKGSMAPQVPWPLWFTNINRPGCARNFKWDDPRESRLGPLPPDWAKYRGHYVHGDKVILKYEVEGREVLEMPGAEKHGGQVLLTRTFRVAPSSTYTSWLVVGSPVQQANKSDEFPAGGCAVRLAARDQWLLAAVVRGVAALGVHPGGGMTVGLASSKEPMTFKLVCAVGKLDEICRPFRKAAELSPPPVDLATLVKGGPKRWGEPLTTQGAIAKDDGKFPYVVDTLTLPFNNPFKSWMRTAAHDFFSDGRLAVSTLNGDVWIVDGIDENLKQLKWTRYATGLYEPLGLKVVNDVIYVLGRDRIMRLHDLNNDGEADFYESFWADGNVAPSFHAFSFDLQTDKAGNFYFLKSGRRVEKDRPGHGALVKVSPDGKKSEIVATGFRHPNGMGIGPHDEIVVSDNQGEWVPSSKVSLIKPGGFYGYPRKGEPTPAKYDPPLFWLPMSVDNSSGGQCWAGERWGPLSGKLLHTSYGMCSLMYVMPQKVGDSYNAAVVEMPLKFRSGIMRARVNPKDGQVYVVGLRGWQTQAQDVGCVERVRYTGAKGCLVTGVTVDRDCLTLQFSEPAMLPLTDTAVSIDQWNYLWSHHYGSPHMSPSEPTKVGHDKVALKGIVAPMLGKWLGLELDLQPVHQMRIRLDLRGADGTAVRPTVYLTINALP